MANIDLLQHELERFGVVTVMDATIYDYEKGNAVLFLDTLKLSNISAEGQEKQITGGKYADLLLTYNFGRSVNLEFQDALISPASMKQLWGAVEKEGDASAHGYKNVAGVAATDDLTLTLTQTGAVAIGVTDLKTGIAYVKHVGTEAQADDTWTQAGLVVTIKGAADLADDRNFRVDYTYEVDGAKELVVKSSSFPKTVKLVGKTFVLNQRTGQEVEIEIEVPKLKLASNFTMTLDAEGDASVFDFSGMALIDGADKELFKIRTLG